MELMDAAIMEMKQNAWSKVAIGLAIVDQAVTQRAMIIMNVLNQLILYGACKVILTPSTDLLGAITPINLMRNILCG